MLSIIKKKLGYFFLQLNLHYWSQFTETICYHYLTSRAQWQRIQPISKGIHKIDWQIYVLVNNFYTTTIQYKKNYLIKKDCYLARFLRFLPTKFVSNYWYVIQNMKPISGLCLDLWLTKCNHSLTLLVAERNRCRREGSIRQ